MGGFGSTRWGKHQRRLTVEECFELPIRPFYPYIERGMQDVEMIYWRNQRGPVWAAAFITCASTLNVFQAQQTDRISLTTTGLRNGGNRWWFICPQCQERRCYKLYLRPDRPELACRSCHNLTYMSSQQSRRANWIEVALAKRSGLSIQRVMREMKRQTYRKPLTRLYVGDKD